MGLKFHTYICGSIRDKRNAQKLCLESLAQEIIFELNKNPLSLNEIISRYGLKSSSIVKELLSANVLKIKDDKIYVNFSLFTLNDLKKLRIIGEHYGEALAEKVLESSDKIDSVIKEIKYLDYISMDKARFIIVGCYILDLRSLKFFREKGIGSCEVENNGISLEELRDKFKVNEKTFDNIIQVLSDLEYIELWKGKVVLKAPILLLRIGRLWIRLNIL